MLAESPLEVTLMAYELLEMAAVREVKPDKVDPDPAVIAEMFALAWAVREVVAILVVERPWELIVMLIILELMLVLNVEMLELAVLILPELALICKARELKAAEFVAWVLVLIPATTAALDAILPYWLILV